jgi:hypothetical protein
MVNAGVLETPTTPLRKCILNKYFLIRKPSGVLRLIFSGKRVNRCMNTPPPFSMDTVSHITSNIARFNHTHASELDLTSAYYQISVAPSFRRFLCISTITHGILQFTRLPMGMSWAAFCLHKSLSSTIRTSPHPLTTHTYADNIYPMGPSLASTTTRLQATELHLRQHGWVLNADKRRAPFTVGDLLGIHINLNNHTTQPTTAFRTSLQNSTASILAQPTRHSAQCLLGSTVWAAQADPSFLHHTHHLVNGISRAHDARHAPISLTPPLVDELHALTHHAATSLPYSIPTPLPDPHNLIYSDASTTTGAFSHVNHSATNAHLNVLDIARAHKPSLDEYNRDINHTHSFPTNPSLHINNKEALALDAGLHYAADNALADTVFAIDSQALFGAVRKGRSNNPYLHASASLFSSLRADGLRPRIAWTSTMNNFSDIPTRVPLGMLDTNNFAKPRVTGAFNLIK